MVEYTQQTDANGLAEFELAYGDYSVIVSYDDVTVTQDVAFRKNHKNFPIPIGKGKVTATVLDVDEETPISEAYVVCCSNGYMDFSNPNFEDIVGINQTDSDGVCTLKIIDGKGMPTEDDAEIVFGTYYLTAFKLNAKNPLITNMMLTINQSEVETTITLEPIPSATVTITCKDEEDNPLGYAWVELNVNEWTDNADEDGVVIFNNVYYGTYPLTASYTDMEDNNWVYDGTITIDSETVTETITLSLQSIDGDNQSDDLQEGENNPVRPLNP